MIDETTREAILKGYGECALWSSTFGDDVGMPLDDVFTVEDFSDDAIVRMRADVDSFVFDCERAGILADVLNLNAELGCNDPAMGLRSELQSWKAWVEGDVIGYVVKGENGEVVDSCWGFYPDGESDPVEYVRQEARDAAEWEAKQRSEAADKGIATR